MKIIINQYNGKDIKAIEEKTGLVADKFQTLPTQRMRLLEKAVELGLATRANEYVDFGTHKAFAAVVTFK